jgi:hypothetical protein
MFGTCFFVRHLNHPHFLLIPSEIPLLIVFLLAYLFLLLVSYWE